MDQINFLPDHVLAEIFGNLSPRMIKCCALVCKRWDNIIGTSTETMGRFKLELDKSDTVIQEAKNLQRNHQAIEACFNNESLDVIVRHNLKSLILTAWNYDDTTLSLLIKTLNNLPLVKYLDLSLYPVITDDHQRVRNNFVELSCNLEIIHIFDCCTVEKLRLGCGRVDDKMKMEAVDFLKKQKYLKTLKLIGGSGGELFSLPGIHELNFLLMKLEIYCGKFHYYESLIKFLDRHKNSLTHLNSDFHTEPGFGIELIHKFALENLVNLKHLGLGHIKNDVYFHDKKLTYDELPAATQITRNLESLNVTARSSDINENKRFYDMFPNLKRLKFLLFKGDYNEVFECIHERCVNLESLTIGRLERYSKKIYFPKLKEFTVYSYDEEEKRVCSFIRQHSETLEKIIIEDDDIGFNLVAEEIIKCPKLNYLKMDRLRINPSVVRILNEISQKSTPFTLYIPSIKNPFKFPDDKALWDEEYNATRADPYYSSACDMQ